MPSDGLLQIFLKRQREVTRRFPGDAEIAAALAIDVCCDPLIYRVIRRITAYGANGFKMGILASIFEVGRQAEQ